MDVAREEQFVDEELGTLRPHLMASWNEGAASMGGESRKSVDGVTVTELGSIFGTTMIFFLLPVPVRT